MSCPKIPTQFPVKAVVLGGGKGARAYSPSEKRACNSHSDCTNIEIFSDTKNINIAQHVHANTAYRTCSKNSNTEKFRWLY